MLIRKLLSVAATGSALAVAVVVPALPGAAAPSGGCPYPPNRPVLSLTVSPATVVATHKVTAFGKFSQNNCGIKNASIVLQHRALVSGKPSGSWHNVKTVTTTSQGTFAATSYPRKNEQERVVFTKAGSYPTTLSAIRSVLVRTHVTFNETTLSACRIKMSGATIPVKANRTVKIQARDPKGQFAGWTTLASTKTNTKGVYSFTKTAACGTTYNLSARIGADSVNGYGRSRTVYGIKTHK
jgi:hypothetical protein